MRKSLGDEFGQHFYNVLEPQGTYSYRLEICLAADDRVTLKRLLINGSVNRLGPLTAYTPEDSRFEITGLQEAVFGDASKLKIIASRLHKEGTRRHGAVVWGFHDESSTRTLSAFLPLVEMSEGKWVPSSHNGVIGVLEAGDFLIDTRCPTNQEHRVANFKLGTADFTIEFCGFQGGGITLGYKILSLSVQDSNERIPLHLRNQRVDFEGEALEAQLAYAWHHHNACDSFFLKVPQLGSEYGVTATPSAGWSLPMPGAPEQPKPEWAGGVPGALPGSKALYRANYRGEVGPVEEATFQHFLIKR